MLVDTKCWCRSIMAAVPLTQRVEGELRHFAEVHHLAAALDHAVHVWRQRHDIPTVAFINAPLGMIAAALLGEWWMWIPLLAVSAAAMPSWKVAPILTIQMGFVGTEWAIAGTSYLAQYQGDRLVIGIAWIAFPAALAVAGHLNRRRTPSR